MDDILQSKPLLGFPLCCNLFSSMDSNFQKGAAFFSCPSRELIKAITALRFTSKETYFVLAYAALRNKTIYINDIDEELVNELSHIIDAGNISFKTIVDQVVVDTKYFRWQQCKMYAIKHLSIYKAVIVSLSELSLDIKTRIIKVLHPSILTETLRPEEKIEEQYAYHIVVSESQYPVVAHELIQRIEQGYPSLFCCELWDSISFINEIIRSEGSRWPKFCLHNFRYGCKYGKLHLIQKMFPQIPNASIGNQVISIGLKEACINGHTFVLRFIFDSRVPAVYTDQDIQLMNIAWSNYDLCSYVLEKLSSRQMNITQYKTLLSHLARDDETCFKLFKKAMKLFKISSIEVVCNTAVIAGKRGSLHVLQWLLEKHVEYKDDILDNTMKGVCKGRGGVVLDWLIKSQTNFVKEHLLKYTKLAETPHIVQQLLKFESQLPKGCKEKLSKLELGDLLNEHSDRGHCLIVKIIIDECDCFSHPDIFSACKNASRRGNLDVFKLLCDTYPISLEVRTEITKDLHNKKSGIKTPMSLNPYTPVNYRNIPSVNISTPIVYAMKHPQKTSTREWKKSTNAIVDREYNRALKLNKLVGTLGNLNSDENILKEFLMSEPKMPEFLLYECAKYACKQQKYKALQFICEHNESIPLNLLVNSEKDLLGVEAIRRVTLIIRDSGKHSLSLLVKHVTNGKDLQNIVDMFGTDFQFYLKDYLDALNYLIVNYIQNAHLLLDASINLAQCDDVLVQHAALIIQK